MANVTLLSEEKGGEEKAGREEEGQQMTGLEYRSCDHPDTLLCFQIPGLHRSCQVLVLLVVIIL